MKIEDIIRNFGPNFRVLISSGHLETFKKDAVWFDENYKDLRRTHQDEWIAVYGQRVIAHHKDMDNLLEQLDEKGVRGKAFVKRTYFNEEEPTYIFSIA